MLIYNAVSLGLVPFWCSITTVVTSLSWVSSSLLSSLAMLCGLTLTYSLVLLLICLDGTVKPADNSGEFKAGKLTLNPSFLKASVGVIGGGELINSNNLTASFWCKNPSFGEVKDGGELVLGVASISLICGVVDNGKLCGLSILSSSIENDSNDSMSSGVKCNCCSLFGTGLPCPSTNNSAVSALDGDSGWACGTTWFWVRSCDRAREYLFLGFSYHQF